MLNKDRVIYNNPELGKIDQGYIFYGGIADSYLNSDVWGIVITPRCDIANRKVPTYHYLPIVKYSDWLLVDYKELLYKRINSQLIGELKSFLKENGFSSEIAKSFSISQIAERLSPRLSNQKKVERLDSIKNKILEIDDFYKNTTVEKLQDITKKYIKIAQVINNEIILNQNYSFYLLESWNKEDDYYVVLLRDIRCIKKDIFFTIGQGILYDNITDDIYNKNDLKRLSNQDEMIFVETELCSPYIEHLIQMFFHNFGRIGIDEISPRTSEILSNQINKLQ